MTQIADASISGERFALSLVGLFAAIALVLAALCKLPVGFVFLISMPLAFLLMPFSVFGVKSRLEAVPRGKSKLEMPVRVVTASETETGAGPSSTW